MGDFVRRNEPAACRGGFETRPYASIEGPHKDSKKEEMMLIPFLQNFNVEEYFITHAKDWGTRPVKVIWESLDYVTLLVRGPSTGKEFHVGRGDEIFYQVRGELNFHYVTDAGERKVIEVK